VVGGHKLDNRREIGVEPKTRVGQQRRTNLRTCMGYKGYSRFGLNKDLWQAFNFEEGNNTVPEDERQQYLQMQAKAAITGRPSTQELEF